MISVLGRTRSAVIAALICAIAVPTAIIAAQVTVVGGNGTPASPFVLAGSGDITSYMLGGQAIQ